MNRMVGAIYPVPLGLISRLFDGKVKVFVKYVAHNTTKLVPKHKIVFYASHGPKALIGEGTIEKVEFLTPEMVLAKYKNELFLNEVEFHGYVKRAPSRTPSKEIMVLVLKKLRKYPNPISYSRPITMAGQYLSVNEYASLQEHSK